MQRSLLALALLLAVVPATAQQKDPSEIGRRLGPPAFGPLGGVNCNSPILPIPDNDPAGASDTMTISDTTTIHDLTVSIQATHTWVGDLQFFLTHDDTGTTALIIDRVGSSYGFGCSLDDIDVFLNDAFTPPVEQLCEDPPPAVPGRASPYPEPLSSFAGESIGGDWTMLAIDAAGGDAGTLDAWCVDPGSSTGGGGDGGPSDPDVPATTAWGVLTLIALFLSVSLFYLRRQRGANG